MTAVRNELLHQAVPTGPAANAERTSASRPISSSSDGRLVGAIAEALDRRLEQARDLGEAERAVEEPGDGDLIGGDERGRRALPDATRLAGDPQRGEARLVGGPELEPPGGREIDGDRRRRAPVGIGQGVLDRKPHVGGAQLGLQGAVDEANGRVDDALRVDHHLDRSVGDIVQPVRLDDFQALVGERRRVDRDLRAHRPRRVAEGLLGGHLGEVRGPVEERPARRCQDERGDAGHPLPHQALPDRRMLGVDRAEPGERACQRVRGARGSDARGQCPRERHDEVAAGDERLLVGRRDDLAGPQRGDDRDEADDAARPDDDEIDVIAGRELHQRVGPGDEARPGRDRDAGRGRRIAQADDCRSDAGGLLGERGD